MISKRTISISLVLLLLVTTPALADTIIPNNFTFLNNLKLGITLTPDVSYLQFFLNRNTITKIADTGPGSDSELTNYFGQKTFDAVSRFQNFFASEILTPNGLSAPTGYFGPSTRQKVNSLLKDLNTRLTGQTSNPTAVTTASTTASLAQADAPQIAAVVPNSTADSNEIINIYGYGFTPTNNSILSNIGVILHVSSNANTISIKISDFTGYANFAKTISPGESQDIIFRVKNANGVSVDMGGVVFGTGPAKQYEFVNPYAEEDASTTATSTDSGAGSITTTAVDSQGIVQQAASKDVGLQGMIQVVNTMSSGDPVSKQISGLDPVYSLLGGSAGGAAAGALGGLGGSGGGSTGGTGGGTIVDNFGGQVTKVIECTCSGGKLVTVKDIRGDSKDLFYGYGRSTLHEEYNLTSGVNVVGGYKQSSTECEVYDGEECDSEGTAQGDIDFPRGVGTSLSSGGGSGF